MLWGTLEDCVARAAPGVWIPQTPDGVPLVDTGVMADVLALYPDLRMSYEDFLTLPREVHGDWIDGQVVLKGAGTDRHQDVFGLLAAAVRCWLEVHHAGRSLLNFQMRALPAGPGREVEYLCLTHEHYRERVREMYVDGPGDVVFEILTEATRERDLQMRAEYAAGGVSEYWMIDPEQKWVEVCRLTSDGTYETACDGSSGVLRSEVFPGLWFKTDWLLEEPAPAIDTLLRDLGLLRAAA